MKKLIILMALLCLTVLSFADITIGTGNSTTRYPGSSYWNYYRSANLFLGSEINAFSGTITNLQWYCSTSSTTPMPFKIYLKTTAATTCTTDTWANYISGATEVFNSTVTVSTTGWYDFNITDTAYTSGTNLMVLVETGSTAYTSPYHYWYYTATATNKWAGAYADGTIPASITAGTTRPNIKLVGINLAVYPEPTNHVTEFAVGTRNYTSIQLNWTGSTGAQLPGSYLIQAIKSGVGSYAAVADGTPVANDAVWTDNNGAINVAHVVGANTYTFTGLTPNTTYEFKIWPYTNLLTDINFKTDGTIPTVNGTTLDPTVTVFPYTTDFSTWQPANWAQYNYVYGGTPATGGSWGQDDWLNVVSPVNKAAKANLYYSSQNWWLVTPPIQIPATGYELKFDLALMVWNSLSTPVTAGNQADDRFLVVISDNPDMTSPTTLMEWNNTGSANVFDNIPAAGANYTIDLDGYVGTKYIGFYAESLTDTAGDNDLMVDNVIVRETPAGALYSIVPDLTEPWAFGNVPTGTLVEKNFTISNTGGGTLTIASIATPSTYYSVEEIAPVDHELTTGQSTSFKVKFQPTVAGGPYNGTVTVTYTAGTRATDTIDFTGSAYDPATLPLTEGWEAGQGDWSFVNGTQTNTWYIGTADPYAGTYSAYVSNDLGVSNAYNNAVTSVAHVYTDIAFGDDMLNFPLSFQWKCQGESAYYDYLQVFLVDTSVTPVAGTRLATGQIGANYNLQSTWQTANIVLPGTLSNSTKRLVFSWWNDSSGGTNPPINIDNISLTAVPNPSGPVAAPNLDYPEDGDVDLPKGGFPFQFSWNVAGTEPEVYNLYLAAVEDLPEGYTSDDFFGVATLYEDVTSPYTPAFTYDYSKHYVWTVGGSSTAYPLEVYQWPPYEFVIEEDPSISNFPWDEDFEDGVFPPAGWAVTDVDGVSPIWVASTAQNHTATPGTTSAFHNYGYYDPEEEGWMVTPALVLPVDDVMVLSFWSYNTFPTYYTYNGVWISTTSGTVPGDFVEIWTPASVTSAWVKTEISLEDYAGETVYIAFKYSGYDGHGWYLDDVHADVAPLWDVAPISIDMPEVVQPFAFTPMATVKNNGINAATFDVRMDIGTWNNTQTVTALGSGLTQQVTFASYLPTVNTGENVTVTTLLATDNDTSNDVLSGALICVPLNIQAYAEVVYDPIGGTGPSAFLLNTPGTITDLNAVTPWTGFLTAGDWMNGKWMGVDQTAFNFWDVNPLDGTAIDTGDVTMVMTGITQNTDTGVIYGTNGTHLYTLSATGTPTLVAAMNTVYTSLGIVDMAYDSWSHKLLGACVAYDAVFEIDMATGAVEPLGYTLGMDINYTQGMAFDHANGNLYLAGYSTTGALYWIDPTTGIAYMVGAFRNGAELDGFAIPFGGMEIPEVAIGADGTLSWAAVDGASGYNIYSSDDPYGTFSFEDSTTGLTWLDPAFSEALKFYVVTASDVVVRNNQFTNRIQHQNRGQVVGRTPRRTVSTPTQTQPKK